MSIKEDTNKSVIEDNNLQDAILDNKIKKDSKQPHGKYIMKRDKFQYVGFV